MATWLYQLIVFTTSVIFIICSPSDHPVFSASSSSLFCPFLGDERPNIRPSTIQIQVQPAIMAIETCTSSTSRWCKWRPTVPVSLYPALDVTMSAAEHAHGFHVIQERRILSHVNYSKPPTNRLLYWSTTISASLPVLIDDMSSSTSFLSFACVFRQRQRSYIHPSSE